MLRADTEEKKRKVLEICDFEYETCCNFPGELNDDLEYEEADDRIYLDGVVTFDKLAEIVDYLRGK